MSQRSTKNIFYNEKKQKKYIIFDKKPKQCLNFDKFDSYLNDTIEGTCINKEEVKDELQFCGKYIPDTLCVPKFSVNNT